MATCPKCGTGKLRKRKSDNAFHCKRHGFVRKTGRPDYETRIPVRGNTGLKEGDPTMGNTANTAAKLNTAPEMSLETAKEFDYIICVDKSGSMGEASSRFEGRNRWEEAEEFTEAFARFAGQVDSDGITVIKFDDDVVVSDGVTADKVKELFTKYSPGGGTNLAGALAEAAKKKFAAGKKAICFVITDGIPNSQSDVEKVIVATANKLEDDTHFNLVFVQVGDDAKATKYLDHLDNELTGKAKYDIVNSLSLKEAGGLSMGQLLFQALNH